MDPKTVKKLESKLELAIIEIIMQMGLKRLPLLPPHSTVKMMAKAATAVYEAVVDYSDLDQPGVKSPPAQDTES